VSADTAVVVLAAGHGNRLGRGNKALLPLGDKPLLFHALNAARASSCLRQLVLVMNPEDVAALESTWQLGPVDLGVDLVVPGGASRWLSSWEGCKASDPECELLLVHDCARALVESSTFDKVALAARDCNCALAAAPLADTLKRSGPEQRVVETVAREAMWRAQTPQGAHRELLLSAFSSWPNDGTSPTDEAMLLEAAGHHPVLVETPSSNFKVTTPADLEMAAAILRSRQVTHE
jgi:2-C-methyl-D-erythritol 4-phosphate cytidylyltransferase